jgi:hypothetical protein
MRAGKNGGRLLVVRKGDPSVRDAGGAYHKPITMRETLFLARKASPDAVRTLIRALGSEDQRVAVMSASLLLERAWGKPREQPAEQERGARIDLTRLTKGELDVLVRLAQSGRLTEAPGAEVNEAPGDQVTELPPEIEAKPAEPR